MSKRTFQSHSGSASMAQPCQAKPNKRDLSEKERRILVAAQLKATSSIAALERETGYPSHVIRHSLKRLLQTEIVAPHALINIGLLGFDKVAVFFSLTTNDPGVRKKAIEYLLGLPCVVSVCELVGNSEYVMSIASHGTSDLAAILGQISETIGCFHQHTISSCSAFFLYQRTYLAQLDSPRGFLACHMDGKRLELGHESLEILAAIDEGGAPSPAALARRTGQPISSVAHRVGRLEEDGVVAGYVYRVHVRSLGISTHDILLSTRSSGARMRERMHSFCLGEPNIVGLTHCLGSWQFELRAEVSDPRELVEICNRIKAAFGDDVLRLTTHTIARELKHGQLPLDLSPAHAPRAKVEHTAGFARATFPSPPLLLAPFAGPSRHRELFHYGAAPESVSEGVTRAGERHSYARGGGRH